MADQPNRDGGERLSSEIIGLASQEHQERSTKLAAPPPPPVRPRLTRWAFVLTLPILPIVLALNLTETSITALLEPTPPPTVARVQAQRMINELVVEVELFRKDYNELPGTLFEVGMPERGDWRYTVIGNGQYRIEGTLHQQHVSFESSPEPTPAAQEQAVKP